MKLYVSALKYSNWYQLPAIFSICLQSQNCHAGIQLSVSSHVSVFGYVVYSHLCVVIAMVTQSLGHQLWIRSNNFFYPRNRWSHVDESLKTCCCALHLGTVSNVCCSLRFQSAFWSLLSNSSCTLCLCVFSNHQSLFSAITFSGSSASGVKHILF